MKQPTSTFPYEDILNLPHHQSATRPHMSMYDRAAQFSPFSALTGLDAAVDETARLTDARILLDEYQKAVLDRQLQALRTRITTDHTQPVTASITYFQPDLQKEGGSYPTVTGILKHIHEHERVLELITTDDTRFIPIDDIIEIGES